MLKNNQRKMTLKLSISNSNQNCYRTVQGDLPENPLIRTSLSGCRVIGRMCVGNNHGLLVPEAIYDTELEHIRDKIPESIQIKKNEEKLSALGNVVVCNDQIALVHPELDKVRDTFPIKYIV